MVEDSEMMISFRLHWVQRWKFSSKDPIPNTACNTKPIIVVGEMVLQMIFFQLLVVHWQAVREIQC